MKTENENGKPIKVAGQQSEYSSSVTMLIRQYVNINANTCVFGKFSHEFLGQSVRFNLINQGIFSDKSNLGRDICHMTINYPNQADKKIKEQYSLNARTNHRHLNAPVVNLVGQFPR